MALLNGMYIFVSEEQISNGVQMPEHPVEKGLNLTDYVRPNAMQLTLTGEIVGENATDIVEKIKKIQRAGAFADFSGCSLVENAIISDFSTDSTNKIAGGYAFSMTIRKIRIAGSPYDATSNVGGTLEISTTGTAGVQQVQSAGKQERYHTAKADKFPGTAIIPLDESSNLDLITFDNFNKTIFRCVDDDAPNEGANNG